jgi:hypothetical protein
MATDQKSKSKRVGSTKRAEAARRDLKVIFSDEENPMYLAKDIVFARKYDVTRLTISKIRDEMGVPRRSKGLIERLIPRTMLLLLSYKLFWYDPAYSRSKYPVWTAYI